MFVSVVIPTFNRKSQLADCLQSVLAQHFEDYEVIVVDDGSTDDTEGLVRNIALSARVPVRYVRNEHRGPAAARNLGISKAAGEFIFFIDDDCIVPNDWIKRMIRGFEKYPNVAGVGGGQQPSDEAISRFLFARYEVYVNQMNGVVTWEILGGLDCPVGGATNMCYKRKVLEEVGGFDEFFTGPGGEDADLKRRIADRGYQFLYLPIMVIHNHDYRFTKYFPRYLRQQLLRGRALAQWEVKRSPGHLNLINPLIAIAKAPFTLLRLLQNGAPLGIALIKGFASICQQVGRLQYHVEAEVTKKLLAAG